MIRGILFLLIASLALANSVNAATIYGSVYDLSLKSVNNAFVEINSTTSQFMVAKNGSYSFMVPEGFYVIKAELLQKNSIVASAQENISIKQDGSYILDLILFPDLDLNIGSEADFNESFIDTQAQKNNIAYISTITILFILLVGFCAYYFLKIKKEQTGLGQKTAEKPWREDFDDGPEKIVEIIKSEGGRATQKEIRKQIPWSEAKISLMIAELEHKGIVEKIKKGRGNIIILKKK